MSLGADYVRELLSRGEFLEINQKMRDLNPEDPEAVIGYCETAIPNGHRAAMNLLDWVLAYGVVKDWTSTERELAKAVRQAAKEGDKFPSILVCLAESTDFHVRYHAAIALDGIYLSDGTVSYIEALIQQNGAQFIDLVLDDRQLTGTECLSLLQKAKRVDLTGADVQAMRNERARAQVDKDLDALRLRIDSMVPKVREKVSGFGDVRGASAESAYVKGIDAKLAVIAAPCALLLMRNMFATQPENFVSAATLVIAEAKADLDALDRELDGMQSRIAVDLSLKTLNTLSEEWGSVRESILAYGNTFGPTPTELQTFTLQNFISHINSIEQQMFKQRLCISYENPRLPENFAEQIRKDLATLQSDLQPLDGEIVDDIEQRCDQLMSDLEALKNWFPSCIVQCEVLQTRIVNDQMQYATGSTEKSSSGKLFSKKPAPVRDKAVARLVLENTLKEVTAEFSDLKKTYRSDQIYLTQQSSERGEVLTRQGRLITYAERIYVHLNSAAAEEFIMALRKRFNFNYSWSDENSLWDRYVPEGSIAAPDFFGKCMHSIITEWGQTLDQLEEKLDQKMGAVAQQVLEDLRTQFASMQASLKASCSKLASISGLDKYKVALTQEENEITKMFQEFINEPPHGKKMLEMLNALVYKIKSFNVFEVKKAEFLSEPLSLRYLAFSNELSRKIDLLSKASGSENKLRLLQGVEEKLNAAWGYYFDKLAYFRKQHILEIAVNGGSLVSEFERELNKAEKEFAAICAVQAKGTSALFKDPEETFKNRHQAQEADFDDRLRSGCDLTLSYGVKRNPDFERALPKDLPLPDLSTRMRERLRELESAPSAPPTKRGFMEGVVDASDAFVKAFANAAAHKI